MPESSSSAFLEILLKNQSDNYSFMLNVLTGGIILLFGTQWVWNLYYKQHLIETDVKKAVYEKTKHLSKKLSQELVTKSDSIEKKLSLKYVDLSADLSRNYGLFAEDKSLVVTASEWWLDALDSYLRMNNGEYIAISVKALARTFQDSKWKVQNTARDTSDRFKFEDARKVIDKIPSTLSENKKKILLALTKLQSPD